MSTANNPYKPGDRVAIKRGDGWLAGTVVKIVLARTHVKLDSDDDDGNIVVDNYHDIGRAAT